MLKVFIKNLKKKLLKSIGFTDKSNKKTITWSPQEELVTEHLIPGADEEGILRQSVPRANVELIKEVYSNVAKKIGVNLYNSRGSFDYFLLGQFMLKEKYSKYIEMAEDQILRIESQKKRVRFDPDVSIINEKSASDIIDYRKSVETTNSEYVKKVYSDIAQNKGIDLTVDGKVSNNLLGQFMIGCSIACNQVSDRRIRDLEQKEGRF